MKLDIFVLIGLSYWWLEATTAVIEPAYLPVSYFSFENDRNVTVLLSVLVSVSNRRSGKNLTELVWRFSILDRRSSWHPLPVAALLDEMPYGHVLKVIVSTTSEDPSTEASHFLAESVHQAIRAAHP